MALDRSTLVLVLDGPLQSWGIASQRTHRDTASAPSLSGVVGLLSNALGMQRDADLIQFAGVTFGVRTDRSGVYMPDYQTAGSTSRIWAVKPDKKARSHILTKDYLMGARFIAAIRGDRALVDQWAQAVQHPARAIYLGRRSCVPGKLVYGGTFDEDVTDVLHRYPLAPGHSDEIAFTVESTIADPLSRIVYDRPVSFHPTEREYLPRFITSYTVPSTAIKGDLAWPSTAPSLT